MDRPLQTILLLAFYLLCLAGLAYALERCALSGLLLFHAIWVETFLLVLADPATEVLKTCGRRLTAKALAGTGCDTINTVNGRSSITKLTLRILRRAVLSLQ